MTVEARSPRGDVVAGLAAWPLRCPDCGAALQQAQPDAAPALARACSACPRRFEQRNAVLDLLPERDRSRLEHSCEEYEAVRLAEGRGERKFAELSNLPWAAPGDPFAWEWYIRATSYEALLAGLPRLGDDRSLRVLDLGAGIGWLSRRLALAGHRCLALDLSDHQRVGLGALPPLVAQEGLAVDCVRADYDQLPLEERCADLIVFNASLHYSPDPLASLRAASSRLAADGRLVVMDSPIYWDSASAERMRQARRTNYRDRYGFASDSLGSREYLLAAEMREMGAAAGLRWRWIRPNYGWSWRWRRIKRRLFDRREAADFAILVGRQAEA